MPVSITLRETNKETLHAPSCGGMQRIKAFVIDLLNRFWIAFPLSYALTVGGLVTGYRHGGVPADRRLVRALRAGVPVVLGVIVLWG